jgi:GT2 family glycosyltransferase
MAQRVAIVILNWNGWKDTLKCLQSIHRITYDAYRVVLVDNGSSDESVAKFREYCGGEVEIGSPDIASGTHTHPRRLVEIAGGNSEALSGSVRTVVGMVSKDDLVLIMNERNYGFSEGCNIGMRFSLSALEVDYILLLNNDTIVAPDFLDKLIMFGDSDKRIGILGPKILYHDYCGRNDVIWFAGGVIKPWREKFFYHVGDGESDIGQFDVGGDTEWISGAAMLIKKELAETALLNTAYEFGMEDVEYCLRARKLGYRIVCVPSARIWHKVGVSWRKLGRRIGRDITGHFRLIRENSSSAVYLYHILLFFAILLPKWAVVFFAEGGDKKTMRAFLKDMRRFFGYMIRGSVNE